MLINQNVDDAGRLKDFFRKPNVIGGRVRYSYQIVVVNDKIRICYVLLLFIPKFEVASDFVISNDLNSLSRLQH